jgi:hypothetical protein
MSERSGALERALEQAEKHVQALQAAKDTTGDLDADAWAQVVAAGLRYHRHDSVPGSFCQLRSASAEPLSVPRLTKFSLYVTYTYAQLFVRAKPRVLK